MHDDGDGLAGFARDHRRDALDVIGRHLEGPAVRIDVAVTLLDPGREHDSVVVQRAAQPVLGFLETRGLAYVEQELRDAAPSEAAAKQPCKEPERNGRKRDQCDRDENVLDALADRAGGKARREEGECRSPGEPDRPEHAPRHRRRRAVAHNQEHHDEADEDGGGNVRGGVDCTSDTRLVCNEEDIRRALRARRVRLEQEDQQIREDGERIATEDDPPFEPRCEPARGIGEDEMHERRQHE